MYNLFYLPMIRLNDKRLTHNQKGLGEQTVSPSRDTAILQCEYALSDLARPLAATFRDTAILQCECALSGAHLAAPLHFNPVIAAF